MGLSLPPPAAFELISSFARHRGADIEIVLAEPRLELPAEDAPITLRRGRKIVDASGRTAQDTAGDRLVVMVPRNALTDGTWTLSLERSEGPRERIAARLLVQGQRPPVLLWGAKDPPSAVPKAPRPITARRRTAAAAGKALDRALLFLPEEQARSVRTKARSAARRVLR